MIARLQMGWMLGLLPAAVFAFPLPGNPAAPLKRLPAAGFQAAGAASPIVRSITTIQQSGGRVAWSKARNLIAFDKKGEDGFFDLYTMNPDGSGENCLSCGVEELPGKHVGNPAWHPSGDYIVFQAQKKTSPLGGITDFFANPGTGLNNDVWVADFEGTVFVRLTNVQLGVGGVLHPHFSHNGNRLLWAERVSAAGGLQGTWVIRLADFLVEDGVPSLGNILTLSPGEQKIFYETHGFSLDDEEIFFSGYLRPGEQLEDIDIYRYAPEADRLVNLTRSPQVWDEHARLSPDGGRILWMSSKGYEVPSDLTRLKTDYWLMNADGSAPTRLTYFNEPGQPEFIPGAVAAADSDWSPDGTKIVAYLILDPSMNEGKIVMIELDPDALSRRTLSFPQIADGRAGRICFQSTIFLVNTGKDDLVRVEFFDNAGEPLSLTLGTLGSHSAFEFSLKRGESLVAQTSGEGALRVGYAEVSAASGVSGTVVFTRSDQPSGTILYQAGVPAAEPLSDFTVFVDSLGNRQTGLALVNAGPEEAQATFRLYDADFNQIGQTGLSLGADAHLALFVEEIFAQQGISQMFPELRGSLTVESSRPLSAVTLRQNDDPGMEFPQDVATLTVFPVIPGRADSLAAGGLGRSGKKDAESSRLCPGSLQKQACPPGPGAIPHAAAISCCGQGIEVYFPNLLIGGTLR